MNSEDMDLEIKRIQMERDRRQLQKEIDRDKLKETLVSKIRPMLKLAAAVVAILLVGNLIVNLYAIYEDKQSTKQYMLEKQASKHAVDKCNAEVKGMYQCADNGVQRDFLRKSGSSAVPSCYTELEHSQCIDREHDIFLKSNR